MLNRCSLQLHKNPTPLDSISCLLFYPSSHLPFPFPFSLPLPLPLPIPFPLPLPFHNVFHYLFHNAFHYLFYSIFHHLFYSILYSILLLIDIHIYNACARDIYIIDAKRKKRERNYKVYRAYISFRDFRDFGGDTPSDNISCLQSL